MNKLHEYNGWTNKPTWLVSLWINNNEMDYGYWQERAESALDSDNPAFELSLELEETHKEHTPIEQASIYSDLLQFSLSLVNWQEVAEGLIEEVKDNI